MIRVVAKSKAMLAGIGGAIAAEATLLALQSIGVPVMDLAEELGSIVLPGGETVGYEVGLIAHAAVGIAWALFYAYFFWARLRWAPPLQGLAFAAGPAILAVLFVSPQLQLMQQQAEVVQVSWPALVADVSVPELLGILAAHVAFGLAVGAIYTHPVGYPVGHTPPPPPKPSRRPELKLRLPQAGTGFIFATGIECSYPTIENGRWRRDQLQSTGFYSQWQQDFELCRKLGTTHLRYGPPLHLVLAGPGRYDWSWIDDQMAELDQFGPEPIVDLCHFGLPDWLGNFQNPEIASALADYAGAFAKRYPWVRFYTPVNEMYVCASLSTLEGLWNEQERDETAFVTAVLNLARASIAMTDAIVRERPDAVFINSESSVFTQPCCPDEEIQERADFENERRFLPLDLIYAHPVSDSIRSYLHEHGAGDSVLSEFIERDVPRRSVIGIDYYEWNERLIDSEGQSRSLGELFGWYVIASQYYRRYQRPMMHTETNHRNAGDGARWLWRQWHNVQLLRSTGAPLVGFTWYSLTDQVDWNSELREAEGVVYPVGLFDLNRDVREVGLAYKQLIDMHRHDPEFSESACLKELLD